MYRNTTLVGVRIDGCFYSSYVYIINVVKEILGDPKSMTEFRPVCMICLPLALLFLYCVTLILPALLLCSCNYLWRFRMLRFVVCDSFHDFMTVWRPLTSPL